MYYVIEFLFFFVVFIFVIVKINKKNKEQLEFLKKEFKIKQKEYDNTEEQLHRERLSDLKNQLNEIEKEINQKKEFNSSLLKIREEELERTLQIKKEEGNKLIELELLKQKEQKINLLKSEFEYFLSEQNKTKEIIKKETEEIKKELEDFRLKREAINEAVLREKELQEKNEFYRVNISEKDIEDMIILEKIRPQLKNREALSKLIWEVYIQRPAAEMIKRVTGGKDISGIYKITYMKTGEAYIGKTTSIKTRWQNHLKTVIGLDGAARTTLHTRMEKDGFWNYTFELLEEVPKDKLTEREKYFIKFHNS